MRTAMFPAIPSDSSNIHTPFLFINLVQLKTLTGIERLATSIYMTLPKKQTTLKLIEKNQTLTERRYHP
jgi:hypothetical protein